MARARGIPAVAVELGGRRACLAARGQGLAAGMRPGRRPGSKTWHGGMEGVCSVRHGMGVQQGCQNREQCEKVMDGSQSSGVVQQSEGERARFLGTRSLNHA